MTTRANMVLLVLAGLLCTALYVVKHDTRAAARELDTLAKAIEDERDSLQLLRAEWAMRNEPERLKRLSERHLELEPVSPRQIVTFQELARILPADQNPAPVPATDGFDSEEEAPRPGRPVLLSAAPGEGVTMVLDDGVRAVRPRLAQNQPVSGLDGGGDPVEDGGKGPGGILGGLPGGNH